MKKKCLFCYQYIEDANGTEVVYEGKWTFICNRCNDKIQEILRKQKIPKLLSEAERRNEENV